MHMQLAVLASTYTNQGVTVKPFVIISTAFLCCTSFWIFCHDISTLIYEKTAKSTPVYLKIYKDGADQIFMVTGFHGNCSLAFTSRDRAKDFPAKFSADFWCNCSANSCNLLFCLVFCWKIIILLAETVVLVVMKVNRLIRILVERSDKNQNGLSWYGGKWHRGNMEKVRFWLSFKLMLKFKKKSWSFMGMQIKLVVVVVHASILNQTIPLLL